MKLLTAAVALAAFVLLLPLAVPVLGLLACIGFARDKPAVRPRPRQRPRVADRTAFAETVLATRQGHRLYVLRRTRRQGGVAGLTLSAN